VRLLKIHLFSPKPIKIKLKGRGREGGRRGGAEKGGESGKWKVKRGRKREKRAEGGGGVVLARGTSSRDQ
jgi:hypothetical protein